MGQRTDLTGSRAEEFDRHDYLRAGLVPPSPARVTALLLAASLNETRLCSNVLNKTASPGTGCFSLGPLCSAGSFILSLCLFNSLSKLVNLFFAQDLARVLEHLAFFLFDVMLNVLLQH